MKYYWFNTTVYNQYNGFCVAVLCEPVTIIETITYGSMEPTLAKFVRVVWIMLVRCRRLKVVTSAFIANTVHSTADMGWRIQRLQSDLYIKPWCELQCLYKNDWLPLASHHSSIVGSVYENVAPNLTSCWPASRSSNIHLIPSQPRRHTHTTSPCFAPCWCFSAAAASWLCSRLIGLSIHFLFLHHRAPRKLEISHSKIFISHNCRRAKWGVSWEILWRRKI